MLSLLQITGSFYLEAIKLLPFADIYGGCRKVDAIRTITGNEVFVKRI